MVGSEIRWEHRPTPNNRRRAGSTILYAIHDKNADGVPSKVIAARTGENGKSSCPHLGPRNDFSPFFNASGTSTGASAICHHRGTGLCSPSERYVALKAPRNEPPAFDPRAPRLADQNSIFGQFRPWNPLNRSHSSCSHHAPQDEPGTFDPPAPRPQNEKLDIPRVPSMESSESPLSRNAANEGCHG